MLTPDIIRPNSVPLRFLLRINSRACSIKGRLPDAVKPRISSTRPVFDGGEVGGLVSVFPVPREGGGGVDRQEKRTSADNNIMEINEEMRCTNFMTTFNYPKNKFFPRKNKKLLGGSVVYKMITR